MYLTYRDKKQTNVCLGQDWVRGEEETDYQMAQKNFQR